MLETNDRKVAEALLTTIELLQHDWKEQGTVPEETYNILTKKFVQFGLRGAAPRGPLGVVREPMRVGRDPLFTPAKQKPNGTEEVKVARRPRAQKVGTFNSLQEFLTAPADSPRPFKSVVSRDSINAISQAMQKVINDLKIDERISCPKMVSRIPAGTLEFSEGVILNTVRGLLNTFPADFGLTRTGVGRGTVYTRSK